MIPLYLLSPLVLNVSFTSHALERLDVNTPDPDPSAFLVLVSQVPGGFYGSPRA
ncbi:hypothetical protein SAMD00023353_0802080 [Rosellinia necatrix]|uniref:Uncharacterized protein n=1 Tax=Rosellinia necatrix TaxID=77044 RepID=A0A1S8A6C6_ROSNE|nr:hypothetical protein SAMD00023353_0802080 [Rosellinia necatrix]